MTKKDEISILKKQIADARTMKACGRQIIAQATQIESGAQSRLDALGSKSRRSRKADVLSEEVQIHLIANLTKGAEQSA